MNQWKKRWILYLLCIVVLPFVYAADHEYTIIQLPYTNSITVDFTGTVGQQYTVAYGQFASGESQFTITQNPYQVNVSLDIPTQTPLGTYHSHAYISGNDTSKNTSFEFSIQEVVTENNFSISVQPSQVFDDFFEMSYFGPDTTTVYVNTSRVDQPCSTYPTSFCNAQLQIDSDGKASFIFSPESNGEYVTTATFIYNGQEFTLNETFTVDSFNELEFNFTYSPTIIFPGQSVDFTSHVGSFEDSLSFEWDFENDGNVDATTGNVTKIFEDPGSYVVNLTVEDDIQTKSYSETIYVDGQKYNVTVKVKAGEQLQESAEVTMGSSLKYTNVNGTTTFEVLGGNHSLLIEKSPYSSFTTTLVISESFTYTVDLAADANATVNSSTDEASDDNQETQQADNSEPLFTEDIILLSPETNSELAPDSVIFSYKVAHESIDLCQLYLKHEDKQYLLKDTKSTVEFNELIEFEMNNLRGGNYEWYVKCKADNQEAVSETWGFYIFDENAKEVAQELSDTDKVLTEVNSILVALRKNTDEKYQFVVGLLGLEEKLFGHKEDLESLKETIQGFKVGEDASYLAKEISYSQQKRDKLRKDIVQNMSMVDSTEFIFLPSDKDVETAVPEFLTSLKNTDDINMKKFLAKNKELQKQVTVTTKVYVVELNYLSGEKEYKTIVDKVVEFDGDLETNTYVEVIPKDLAADFSELELFTDAYSVINYDPVIAFDLTAGKRVQYAIKKNLFTSEIEKTSSVILSSEFEKITRIIGLTIPHFVALVLFLVLIVGSSVFIAKTPKLKAQLTRAVAPLTQKVESKFGPLKKARKMPSPISAASTKKSPRLEKVIEHVVELARNGREADAMKLYSFVEQKYAHSAPLRQQELDYKIQWMKHELTLIHVQSLVKKAFDHIKAEIVHDAKVVYDEIVAHYPHLPGHHQHLLKDTLMQLQRDIKSLHLRLKAANSGMGGVPHAL